MEEQEDHHWHVWYGKMPELETGMQFQECALHEWSPGFDPEYPNGQSGPHNNKNYR